MEITHVKRTIFVVGPVLALADEHLAQAREKMLAAVEANRSQMRVLDLHARETDNTDKLITMQHQWQEFGDAFGVDTIKILRLLGKIES